MYIGGYNVFSKDINECVNEVLGKPLVHIISGNPEVLYQGYYNEDLMSEFSRDTSLVIPDGEGVCIAAKFKGEKLTKIAGIDLMSKLLSEASIKGLKVYLVGSSSETVSLCANSIRSKYSAINIVGVRDGYFKENEESLIIEDIIKSSADLVFVAMGCPKQELFISKCINAANKGLFMGVGGSFDVISGTKQRAPQIFIKLKLEWLYRAIKEPFRFKRLFVIPKFLYKAMQL